MKTPTLIRENLYFGVEAQRLRDSAGRVLVRVAGMPPDRATLGVDALMLDFGISGPPGRAMIEQMITGGLLERVSPGGAVYGITDKFRTYAHARIVDPLRRRDAQALLTRLRDIAAHFNRTAVSNKYEIETLAVFGAYMSQADALPELSVGVTGRRRNHGAITVSGRGTAQTEGTDQIRALLGSESNYIRVSFFQQMKEIPRPFSVIFKDES